MKTQKKNLLKSLLVALSLVVVMFAAKGQARADEVTLTGFTTGATSVPFLAFSGNLFNSSTAFGIGALSGSNSLGTFFLATGPQQITGGIFQLDIIFTSPLGINGGQGATYTASVLGSVSPDVDRGGVNIDFDNTPQVFTFSNNAAFGSFTLTLADLFVQSGRSAFITAGTTGQQTAVPEPASLLLLGSGLSGIAAAMRKRRRGKLNEV